MMNARERRAQTVEGTCLECGKRCDGKWQDWGIGEYEYWGVKGNDVSWVLVSDCCEAEMEGYED